MADTPTASRNSPALLRGLSIRRRVIKFAAPIFCSNLLLSVSAAVNSVWIGRYLGEASLAAVSNAHSVMFLVTGAVLGIAMAAAILVGQFVGADKLIEARRVTGTSLVFFAGIAFVLALLGRLLTAPLMSAMQVPEDSLPLAIPYMETLYLAIPSNYVFVLVTSLLRGAGDSKTPLYFMLLYVAIHVLLNPVMIFGVGPIGGAGIVGAAIATIVAPSASLVALIVYLYRRGHPLCIGKSELSFLRVDLAILRELVRKGVPMSVEVLAMSLSGVLMLALVNRFGVDTTAAFSASLQLWVYIQMPALAIAMAVSTMAALNSGAQQFGRVRAIARVGVVYSMMLTCAMVAVAWMLDSHLYQLFLPPRSPALPILSHINRTVAWSFVLYSVSITLFGAMRGMGEVAAPMMINMLMLALRFLLAALLLERWQANAVWWSLTISMALTLPLAVFHYRYGRWRSKSMGED